MNLINFILKKFSMNSTEILGRLRTTFFEYSVKFRMVYFLRILLFTSFFVLLFTVNTCIGLHASIYRYPVITEVHLYYFFEVWQMHAYILRFSGIDAASHLKINIK